MSIENSSKINQLLKQWPRGVVYLSSWLSTNDYSNQLVSRYKKSNWIESIGKGAYIRAGDSITVEGAIYALQKQASSTIHIGGKSALVLLGKSHYLELGKRKVILFGASTEKLPPWFTNYKWDSQVNYYSSSFLPSNLGLIESPSKEFTILISSAPRALMECLYLAPVKQDLIECYELMEGLNNMRPNLIQKLLEECTSVKVKRLFLYMAEQAKHSWFTYINLSTIDLGAGKREIVKNGVYISKYQITVPKELALYGKL